MKVLNEIIEEMVSRTKTKLLNVAFDRTEFHRKCVAHYTKTVLPQLELFDVHLAGQLISISLERLYPVDENVLQASLVVQYGFGVRVLQIRYDYRTQDLSFLQNEGLTRTTMQLYKSFSDFEKLSPTQVYDLIAEFVRTIFKTRAAD